MAKGIAYTETNSVTIKGTPGTSMNVSVIAFADKYTGDTEQDKIDAALASGKGSEPSDSIKIDFPAEKPGKPTALKAENTKYNSTDITFTAPAKAVSYVAYQDGVAKHYVETAKVTFTDEAFAGKKVKFKIVAYNEKYNGADEAAKMKAAIDSGKGGPDSDELEVTFPAKPEDPAVTPTGLAASGTTSSSTTLKCTAGSAKGKYWVFYTDTDKMFGSAETTLKVDDTLYGSKLAGLTVKFSVKEFNDTYPDADTADKSGKGSEATAQVTVEFPEEPAVTPTKVTKGEVTKDSATITWTKGSALGKSWVIEYDDGKSIGMDYTEETSYTLTDAIFGEALAGKTIKFKATEYNDVYAGDTSKNKANAANKSKKGSKPSEPLSVDIPAEQTARKSKK